MDPKPKVDDFDSDWRVEVTSKLDDGVTSSGQSIILDGHLTYKHGSAAPVKVKVKLCKDEGSARKECSWLTRMQGQVREAWWCMGV